MQPTKTLQWCQVASFLFANIKSSKEFSEAQEAGILQMHHIHISGRDDNTLQVGHDQPCLFSTNGRQQQENNKTIKKKKTVAKIRCGLNVKSLGGKYTSYICTLHLGLTCLHDRPTVQWQSFEFHIII